MARARKPNRARKPRSERQAESIEAATVAMLTEPTQYQAASAVMKRLGISRRRAMTWLQRARDRLKAEHKEKLEDLVSEYAARWGIAFAEARAAGDFRAAARLLAQIQRLAERRPGEGESGQMLQSVEFRVFDPYASQEEVTRCDESDGG